MQSGALLLRPTVTRWWDLQADIVPLKVLGVVVHGSSVASHCGGLPDYDAAEFLMDVEKGI